MNNTTATDTRTTETVTISRAEYEGLKAQNQWVMEQLRLIRKKQFGASSEKASEEVLEQLSLLFNEAEVFASEETENAPSLTVRAHARKKSGNVKDILPKDIPVEVVEHRLPEEVLTCPQCGEQMTVIGKEVRESLVFKPAKGYLRQDVYLFLILNSIP